MKWQILTQQSLVANNQKSNIKANTRRLNLKLRNNNKMRFNRTIRKTKDIFYICSTKPPAFHLYAYIFFCYDHIIYGVGDGRMLEQTIMELEIQVLFVAVKLQKTMRENHYIMSSQSFFIFNRFRLLLWNMWK